MMKGFSVPVKEAGGVVPHGALSRSTSHFLAKDNPSFDTKAAMAA